MKRKDSSIVNRFLIALIPLGVVIGIACALVYRTLRYDSAKLRDSGKIIELGLEIARFEAQASNQLKDLLLNPQSQDTMNSAILSHTLIQKSVERMMLLTSDPKVFVMVDQLADIDTLQLKPLELKMQTLIKTQEVTNAGELFNNKYNQARKNYSDQVELLLQQARKASENEANKLDSGLKHAAEWIILSLILGFITNFIFNLILGNQVSRKIEELIHSLKSGKETLDHAIDAVQFGIWEWEIKNDRIHWDRFMCQLFEQSEVCYPGLKSCLSQTLSPPDAERAEAGLKNSILEKKNYYDEFRVMLPSGKIRILSYSSKCVNDDLGQIEKIVGATRDITDDFERTQSIRRLFRIVIHDLANPVSVAQMTCERAEKSLLFLPDDQKLHWKKIKGSLEAIQNIIQATREIEALKSGVKSPELSAVKIERVLSNLTSLFETKLTHKKITLKVVDPHSVSNCSILANETLLTYSILGNLLSNAIKFSPADSTLELFLHLRGETEVQIILRDHGVGMPKNMVESFTRGQQLKSSQGTLNEAGTGFGLALAKAYTEAMGAKFDLKSQTAQEAPSDPGTEISLTWELKAS